MKNVLFTTTALVALAGAAAAEVSFSGELTAGYNDEIEGGLFWNADLDLSASVDMGDNVTATATVQLGDWINNGGSDLNPVTVEIAYSGSFDASLKYGDLGDKGASEYYYADRDGLVNDVENHDGNEDVRAMLAFGNFGLAVGCSAVSNGTCDDGMNVGLGATFGSIEVGLGYDEAIGGGQVGQLGVSVDAEFGAMSVGVSYISSDWASYYFIADTDDSDADVQGTAQSFGPTIKENAYAVVIGYEVSSALSASAYYAENGYAGSAYGVGVDYTSGALTVSAYFDHTVGQGFQGTDGTDGDGDGQHTSYSFGTDSDDSYGVDVSYAVNDQLTANAGVNIWSNTSNRGGVADTDGTSYYVGVDYAVNDAITATISYANADEISGPEYKDGISAFITASF